MQAGDVEGMRNALFQVHETQAFWALPGGAQEFGKLPDRAALPACASPQSVPPAERVARHPGSPCTLHPFPSTSTCTSTLPLPLSLSAASVQRVDYEHLGKEPADVKLNIAPGAEPLVTVRPAPGSFVCPARAAVGVWRVSGHALRMRQPRLACWSQASPPLAAVLWAQGMGGPEDDVFQQVEKKAVAPNKHMVSNPKYWSDFYVSQLRPKLASGTFESRKVSCGGAAARRRCPAGVPAGLPLLPFLAACPCCCALLIWLANAFCCALQSYLSMSESETAATSVFAPYRQHEVSAWQQGLPAGGALLPGRRHNRAAGACWLQAPSTKPWWRLAAAPLSGPPHEMNAPHGCAAQVAIPLERAASCLEEVGAEVYGPDKLWEGTKSGRTGGRWAGGRPGESKWPARCCHRLLPCPLPPFRPAAGARTPFLIRFIPGEKLYLSPSQGEPHMYINFEVHGVAACPEGLWAGRACAPAGQVVGWGEGGAARRLADPSWVDGAVVLVAATLTGACKPACGLSIALTPGSGCAPQDFVSLSTGQPNEPFERIAALFRERCGARWHWG